MMKILVKCSVLWVLVCCVVAQSDVNDDTNLQHIVSEILRRLDEKDTQIKNLHQRLAEQEKLSVEQTNRLADQGAVIEKLQQRLRRLESESDHPAEIMENASKSMSSNKSVGRFKQEGKSSVRKRKYILLYTLFKPCK